MGKWLTGKRDKIFKIRKIKMSNLISRCVKIIIYHFIHYFDDLYGDTIKITFMDDMKSKKVKLF